MKNANAVDTRILWVDDEIDLLKPHIILLKQRGYNVDAVANGRDAVAMVRQNHYELVFLDEMMLGLSGLETLELIKEVDDTIKIVMVTKNEEETLMEEAIGKKVSDYITKPVNPTQIVAICKKLLETERISKEKFTERYFAGFNQLNIRLQDNLAWSEWVDVYQKLTAWSLEIDKIDDDGLKETLAGKWTECNQEFSRFVENNYVSWLNYTDARNDNFPIMSPHILDNYIQPILKEDCEHLYFIVVDCMRYDQWLVMQEMLNQYFSVKTNLYCSILPTATPYARNSIFAGLFPIDIKKHYPQYWQVSSNSEDHKQNAFEKDLLETWLGRRRLEVDKLNFFKVFDTEFGKKLEKDFYKYMKNRMTTVVVNSIDMIAHSRSDHAILKEIAPDESAYRSLTKSWFMHSSLFGILKQISEQKNAKIVITTDHGSIRCLRGIKVLGDKETSTNLRYKFGKNVNSDPKCSLQFENPNTYKLPNSGLTVNNIIAKEDYYFVYPTDYHQYLAKFRDSFQHGGISLEEMVIPVIEMQPR